MLESIQKGFGAMKGLSEEEKKEILPDNVILLGYRGSISHGTYVPQEDKDSIDDKDIMGVCIGNEESYFGLERFEQKERQLREWDSVVYEIRKYVRLLLKSNPNVLSLLWLKPHLYILKTPAGERLIENRNLFVSKKVYHSFNGYAYGQFKRMTHFKFEGYMGAKRKRLVEKFGYDCKNAAHLIRLLRMGIEFLTEGELFVHRKDAQQLISIKKGEWSLEKVKVEAERLFRLAEEAYTRSPLPSKPNYKKVNELLMDITRNHWSENEKN